MAKENIDQDGNVSSETQLFYAHSDFLELSENDEESFVLNMSKQIDHLLLKVDKHTERGSNWMVLSIQYLDVTICKHEMFTGGGYFRLPTHLVRKNALLNPLSTPQNEGKCFKYCLLAAAILYNDLQDRMDAEMVGLYSDKEIFVHSILKIDFTSLSFPTSFEMIRKFLRSINTISVNIFGLDDDSKTLVYAISM